MPRCRPLFGLLLAAALLAVACTSVTPVRPQPAASPVLTVDVPDLEIRALLLLLVDRQTYESYSVDRARSGDASVREQLAVTLGRVGDLRGLPVLEELAVDDAVEVRRAAAFALGQLAEPAAARALRRAVADEDRRTGELAVAALAKIGAGLEVVVEAGRRLAPAELDARLLPSLWRFSGVEVVRRGERGLAGSEPGLRANAAYALARNPRREAVATLRDLLVDADPLLRSWAARALGRVGDATDFGRLLPLLEDDSPGPTIRALGSAARLLAAGQAAAPRIWRRPLLELLDSPHLGVRLAATQAAGFWLLDEELGDRLVEMTREARPGLRRAALVALAQGDEPRAARQLLAAAAAADPRDRAAAAAAAGVAGDRGLLRRLCEDDHPRVRQEALATLLETDEEQTSLAAVGLADPDPGVRAATLGWLADNPVMPALDLLGAIGGAKHAGDLPELPLNGIRALMERARAAPEESAEAAFGLERFADSESHLLRREAATALVELGRSRPPVGTVDSGRRVADYEHIIQQTWRPRRIELLTEHGAVEIELSCREAPLNCLNFLQLVELGFYDGLEFHRVVPDFVVQGGDPRGDGWGGPGYTVRDEVGPAGFGAGALGMALGGADTGGSQFFITLSPQPHLDGSFTAFGRVVAGWQALERIAGGDRILSATEMSRSARSGRRGSG